MSSILDSSPSQSSAETQASSAAQSSSSSVNDQMAGAAGTFDRNETTTGTKTNFESTNTATTTTTTTTTENVDDLNSDTNENGAKKDDSMFECNICLDTAKEAVVSMCGHLFCWPCLHQWLETRPTRQLCPVCKAAISKEKVIPLYGRGSTKEEDPR